MKKKKWSEECLFAKLLAFIYHFVISYLGENKQKEGGGNQLQRIGSVIYSLLVQVGYILN